MFKEAEPDLAALGALIRERRRELGLTQSQFGERLGWVQERISLLENGKYGLPSLPALFRLAGAAELPLSQVLHAVGYSDEAIATVGQGRESSDTSGAMMYTMQRILEIDAIALPEALTQAADLLSQTMGAEKIDAFLYEPETATLVAVGTSHTPTGILQHQLGLHRLPVANRGRAVQVYISGAPYLNGRTDEDPEDITGIKEELRIRSSLYVPLTVNGELRGVLGATSLLPDKFSEDDLRFFQVVSRWVGLVAHRAELVAIVANDAANTAKQVAAEEVITIWGHDLRNHLTPLKGRIDMLRRRALRENREQDVIDADAAGQALGRIQRITDDLLDASRLEQGIFALSVQPVELVGLTQQISAGLMNGRQTIQVQAPTELMIEADPQRLSQVLENLLTNALRYSPADLPVSVTVTTERYDDELRAIVAVRDHGPGITADVLPRIFQRFSVGPGSSGLGLGLYLARRIAEAHGGSLTVTSVEGQGSTFVLALPAIETEESVPVPTVQ
jgi:two-component system OmpR family sensor kinase